jgi:integrase
VNLQRNHIAPDGTISVAQEKTKNRLWVPQSRDLAEALEAWNRTQNGREEERIRTGKSIPMDMKRMVLTGERGKKMTVDHFRHTMIDAFQAVPDLDTGLDQNGVTNHGLRYTAATILKELGCDWETIASITGHETVDMVKKYTEKKRRAQVAIAAMDAASQARIKNNEDGKVANAPGKSG